MGISFAELWVPFLEKLHRHIRLKVIDFIRMRIRKLRNRFTTIPEEGKIKNIFSGYPFFDLSLSGPLSLSFHPQYPPSSSRFHIFVRFVYRSGVITRSRFVSTVVNFEIFAPTYGGGSEGLVERMRMVEGRIISGIA